MRLQSTAAPGWWQVRVSSLQGDYRCSGCLHRAQGAQQALLNVHRLQRTLKEDPLRTMRTFTAAVQLSLLAAHKRCVWGRYVGPREGIPHSFFCVLLCRAISPSIFYPILLECDSPFLSSTCYSAALLPSHPWYSDNSRFGLAGTRDRLIWQKSGHTAAQRHTAVVGQNLYY